VESEVPMISESSLISFSGKCSVLSGEVIHLLKYNFRRENKGFLRLFDDQKFPLEESRKCLEKGLQDEEFEGNFEEEIWRMGILKHYETFSDELLLLYIIFILINGLIDDIDFIAIFPDEDINPLKSIDFLLTLETKYSCIWFIETFLLKTPLDFCVFEDISLFRYLETLF